MLVVMQLVFSVLFMCFAGAVYTFQGQWRAKANQLTNQLADAEQNITDANEERDRIRTDLEARAKAAEDARGTAQAELANALTAAQQLTGQLRDAETERQKAIADSQVATTEAAARVVESNALNQEVQSLRTRIAELRLELQSQEGTLLDVQGKLAGAEESESQLLERIADQNDLLRANGIDPRATVTPGSVPEQVEKVDGFVAKAQRNATRSQELVEITVGSDDKIYKDMTLIVFREDKYICQMRVMKVYPDTAVCVVREATRYGSVQVGDNVTTKL